jgi:hypothetical protein
MTWTVDILSLWIKFSKINLEMHLGIVFLEDKLKKKKKRKRAMY